MTRATYLVLFALPMLLCTCADLVGTQMEPVSDGYFDNISQPDTSITGLQGYVGTKMIIQHDSFSFYSPFSGMNPTKYPAYAADSSARFPDTLYAIYQPSEGGQVVDMRIHGSGGISPTFSYRRAPETSYAGPPDDVVGKTYRFDVEGEPVVLYFMSLENPLPLTYTRETLGDVAYDFRRTDTVRLPDGRTTSSISYGQKIGNNQTRIHRLLVSATEDGTPQLYLRHGFIYEPDVVKGPYVGELIVSPVPANEAEQNIFQQLSRGRIEVQPLPPEPDSLKVAWQLEYFLERQGIRKRDAPKIDFEFNEDGTYKMLVGERILRDGLWTISADRNFIIFSRLGQYYYAPELRYFTDFTEDYIAFTLPIQMLSDRQIHGDRPSYFEPEVEFRFYR